MQNNSPLTAGPWKSCIFLINGKKYGPSKNPRSHLAVNYARSRHIHFSFRERLEFTSRGREWGGPHQNFDGGRTSYLSPHPSFWLFFYFLRTYTCNTVVTIFAIEIELLTIGYAKMQGPAIGLNFWKHDRGSGRLPLSFGRCPGVARIIGLWPGGQDWF